MERHHLLGLGRVAKRAGQSGCKESGKQQGNGGQGRNRGSGRLREGTEWAGGSWVHCGLPHSRRKTVGFMGLLRPPTVTVKADPGPSSPH